MSSIQDYKCPACDGALEFDSASQKLKCPYCDSEYDINEVDAAKYEEAASAEPQESFEWEKNGNAEWQEGEDENLRQYVCEACGGEIIADANTVSTECPYCNSNIVLSGNVVNQLKPDLVIPFKLDKAAAEEALKAHVSGKILLPKSFKSQNRIKEIKGLYVPFWLYDAEVYANIKFSAEEVTRWSDSNYNYKKTQYYDVYREGSIAFDNIPVDASAKIDNALMESIEPYNMGDALEFNPAYLAGFYTDKYDVSAANNINRAIERIKRSTENEFKKTVVGYDSVTTKASNVQLERGESKYALFPVWILNTRWKDKDYTFAMNAQTGKMVGDLPVDNGLYWRWVLGLFFSVGIVAYIIMWIILMH